MKSVCRLPLVKAAFSLLELLVVLTLLAVLAGIIVPAATGVRRYADRVKSLANMRQIGVALRLYANDHDGRLPGHPQAASGQPPPEQWPALLASYLSPSDPRVFLDPSDPQAAKTSLVEVLSNDRNYTSYVYNGFENASGLSGAVLGALPLVHVERQSRVMVFAQKKPGAAPFDLVGISVPVSLVETAVYDGGAHYVFADGSARYLKKTEYSDQLWLVDQALPPP